MTTSAGPVALGRDLDVIDALRREPVARTSGENVRSGGSHRPVDGGMNSSAPGATSRRDTVARSLKLSSSIGVSVDARARAEQRLLREVVVARVLRAVAHASVAGLIVQLS